MNFKNSSLFLNTYNGLIKIINELNILLNTVSLFQDKTHVESVKVEFRRSIGITGSCLKHSSIGKTIELYQFHRKNTVYLYFKYKISKLCIYKVLK